MRRRGDMSMAACRNCGSPLTPAMRFCGRCGMATPTSRQHHGLSTRSSGAAPPRTPLAGQAVEDHQAERYLVGLLNRDRAGHGVGPLKLDAGLSRVARGHSHDLIRHNGMTWDGWPHTGSDGSSPFERMAGGGYRLPPYRTQGENVGYTQGYPSSEGAAAEIDAGMMAEPAGQPNHRGNILNPQFQIVGVGIVVLDDWVWITEDFAG